MLADINDESLAVGQDVAPGFDRHVGDNDEGLFAGDGFDLGDEIVGLGVVGPFGAGEEGEGFTPGRRLESGVWFPGEEVRPQTRGHANATEVTQGAAHQREGAFEEIGADEGIVGAEAVEDHDGFARPETRWIVFADARAATTGERANGRGPMHLLCAVAGAVRTKSAWLAGSIAGLEACAIPGVVELTGGEEFLGHERLGEDENLLIDEGLFREAKEIEREGRGEGAGVL